MAYVVTDACKDCKFTDCVTVCPVNCFYDVGDHLVIHPDECIDCHACVVPCPVNACVSDEMLAPDQLKFLESNKREALALKAKGIPYINKRLPSMISQTPNPSTALAARCKPKAPDMTQIWGTGSQG